MPIIPVNRAGEHGIYRDVAAHSLPLNAWSAGNNIRFLDGAAEKFTGHSQVFGTPQVVPYWLLPIPTPTDGLFFWLYAGLTKVYVVDQASLYSNLTRQTLGVDVDYTATAVLRWNGGVFNGLPVINNGVDAPQMWNPMSTAQRLQTLSNWPANYLARTIVPFKNYLVALGINKNGLLYPRMVKWSHPADPGLVPPSWDEANETLDAGEYELSETGDHVVDAIPLGDVLAIYKEDNIWAMQHVGGIWVFRFFKLLSSIGVLSTDWVLELRKSEHIVFTGDDLIVHNGSEVQSVLQGRWRKWLRANLSSTNFKRSFLVKNLLQNEIWLCFPSTGATLPDRALIFNWATKSLTSRTLPGVAHGAYSINKDLAQRRLLLADATNTLLLYADETQQFAGANITATLERTAIGLPLKVGEPPDVTTDKFHRRLWPRITGTAGGVIKVYTAVTQRADQAPTYGAAQDFTIGTTESLDILKTGVFFNLKFESTTNIEWILHGYEIDVDLAGKRSH